MFLINLDRIASSFFLLGQKRDRFFMITVGIDYGTSNSEVVWFDGKEHHYIELDSDSRTPFKIRSSVFIYYEDDLPLPPVEVIQQKVDRIKLSIQAQLDKAKDKYEDATTPTEQKRYLTQIDQLRGEYHNTPKLQRRAINELQKDQSVDDLPLHTMVETGTFLFGEAGFKQYLKTPEKGRLIYSPKNFLGANLLEGQQKAFVGLIAKQLQFFKDSAEKQLGQKVSGAVIGRPVKYHGTRGEQGNRQAIEIMTKAAAEAGFEHVDFLEEPIAAAYRIEQQLDSEKVALVVDIGGGTTDICAIRLGTQKQQDYDRQQDVLSVSGTRLGGMECDKNLILKSIAPSMGLGTETTNGIPIPPLYYNDMVAVDDIPRLNKFFSDEMGLEIAQTMSVAREPELIERLLMVQEEKLSARLVNSSRMAKEMLSEKDHIVLPLKYIESDFQVELTEADLKRSMNAWMGRVKNLIKECLDKSPEAPEILFITGGMSLSPVVQKEIKAMLPDLPIVTADAFKSISEGLSIQAQRR